MVKAKKSGKSKQKAKAGGGGAASSTAAAPSANGASANNSNATAAAAAAEAAAAAATANVDDLQWLRECDIRRDLDGEAYLQLEYQEDDELMILLKEFLERSTATKAVVDELYQIWQATVLSTLLSSSALWKKETVQAGDQRLMKDQLKTSRYKINFLMHHTVGSMLSSTEAKWKGRHEDLVDLCFQTLQLLPRLAESCPHHKTDIRQAIIHFEGKEFLAAVACETWDTLYDFSIPIDPDRFIPILRRCAMLDILDKDWNMLGGWEDVLKGLEAKCCSGPNGAQTPVLRLPCDSLLHEHTTILRNARNSMQCKFFSVRFMRYTEDQAPQRWRYFPKCSAPACANIETPLNPHPHRCQKCWYFHYCSEACQEYCDTIMGLHPKFCGDTPPSKASQCRHETFSYLGWPLSESGSDLTCRACGMSEQHLADMKRCSKCHSVYYCSRQCQEWDWRVGGHRLYCKRVIDPGLAAATTAAGNGVSAIAATLSAVAGAAGGTVIKELN
jgi:MYND finger